MKTRIASIRQGAANISVAIATIRLGLGIMFARRLITRTGICGIGSARSSIHQTIPYTIGTDGQKSFQRRVQEPPRRKTTDGRQQLLACRA
jgi:hypothetical protein